jgi:hypothetical protein
MSTTRYLNRIHRKNKCILIRHIQSCRMFSADTTAPSLLMDRRRRGRRTLWKYVSSFCTFSQLEVNFRVYSAIRNIKELYHESSAISLITFIIWMQISNFTSKCPISKYTWKRFETCSMVNNEMFEAKRKLLVIICSDKG